VPQCLLQLQEREEKKRTEKSDSSRRNNGHDDRTLLDIRVGDVWTSVRTKILGTYNMSHDERFECGRKLCNPKHVKVFILFEGKFLRFIS
jgi:hypothetical protein